MNKLKKAFVTMGVAAALAVGGSAGSAVVSAQPAQAYSGPYAYYQIVWGCVHYYAWVDYNWWQEYFEGKRDGYKLVAVEC